MKNFKHLFLLTVTSLSLFATTETEITQSEDFYTQSLSELLNTETELKAKIGSRDGERSFTLFGTY